MNREKEPLLFDLPSAEEHKPVRREAVARREAQSTTGTPREDRGAKVVPLFPGSIATAASVLDAATVVSADSSLGRRLAAATISGSLQAIGLGVTAALAWRMLPPGSEMAWLPFGFFALLWSCAFTAIPLAFFRRTAGMAVVGLRASSLDRSPLSFGQAFRRWLGGLLTVLLAGLPGLLATRGRSLADRLSGSRTLLF